MDHDVAEYRVFKVCDTNVQPMVTLSTGVLMVRIFLLMLVLSYIYIYTECPRRNVPDFGRVFLMLKYNDITQNTYVKS